MKKNLDIVICIAAIIAVCLVFSLLLNETAEGAQPLNITIFRGVDQSVDALDLEPGQASGGYDWNLGKRLGSMCPREGFALYSNPGSSGSPDTLGVATGIHGYIGKYGERRLFATIQSDEAWDYAIWTDEYGSVITNEEDIRFYENEPTHWLTIDDKVVVANGINSPARWVDDGWQPLTESPPGEPRLDPVKTSNRTYFLDGDYQYYLRFGDSGYTQPLRVIHVDSGHVMISAIPLLSIYRNDADTVWPTSFSLYIARTKAGISQRDSMFYIDRGFNDNNPNILFYTRANDTLFIDSIPDCSLGVTEFWDDDVVYTDTTDCTGACDSTRINYPNAGIPDTTKSSHDGDTTFTSPAYEQRPGQPQWLSTIFDTTSVTGYAYLGISADVENDTADDGIPVWRYTHYAVAYYDTATMMHSALGSYVRIPTIFDDVTSHITDSLIELGLALPPIDKEYCYRIIYRRMEKETKEEVPDSAYAPLERLANYTPGGVPFCLGPDGVDYPGAVNLMERGGIYYCVYGAWQSYDSTVIYNVIDPWYPVDTIKNATDSVYKDTLPWNTLTLRDAYNSDAGGIYQLNFPTYYDNRLWMASGSYLFYCDYRFHGGLKIGNWPYGNVVTVSLSDGDITGLFVSGGRLLIFYNNSIYEAKEIDYQNVVVREVTKAYGCIASNSITSLPSGGYGFLSRHGYKIHSTALQSLYKEYTGTEEGISAPIQKSLNSYGIDVLRDCHAFIDEEHENLCLSFPGVDTTWALALNGTGWLPYRYSLRQTTTYSADYEIDARPPDDMVGILNASDSLFSLGGTTDTGKAITPLWTSGPLFRGPWYGQIREYGISKSGADSTGLAVIIDAYREAVGESVQDSLIDTTGRYAIHEIMSQAGIYFQIGIYSTNSDTIQQLDIWWDQLEDLPRR